MVICGTTGNVDDVDRYSKRTVHMTKQHQDDCKQLLRLMGMPVVEVREILLPVCHAPSLVCLSDCVRPEGLANTNRHHVKPRPSVLHWPSLEM